MIVSEYEFVLGATVAGTFTVRVALVPDAEGVRGGGAEQVTPGGAALQLSVTGWLKPFDPARLTV